VFYFYLILSSFNQLKTISEGVLLLPNTVTLEQVEDYIRGCSTSTKYCYPWTSGRLYQRMFYDSLQIVQGWQYFVEVVHPLIQSSTCSRVTAFGRSRTPSDIVFNLFKGDSICQRVFYFYQILSPLNKLKTISEGVLLLPNTVTLEQVEDYIYYSLQLVQGCQYLVEVEHPLI
jgi:uncharacterized protein (DUF1499 family)